MTDVGQLRARFSRAVRAAGGAGAGDAMFDDLVARYGEAHRRHHTLVHIDACLAWFDWFHASAEHSAEVELALWFHDAVYDVRRRDNERASADLARAGLTAAGVATEVVDRIVDHIEATEHHLATKGDAALVVDLDLTILGASRRDFDRFEADIRLEYAHVPEADFITGRRAILEEFLSRPEIYRTPAIRDELEVRARDNLARRIVELSER